MASLFGQLSGPVANALRGTGDRTPNNVLGIVAMLAATAVFIAGDVIMKIMATRLPTGETMFIRGIIGTALAWSLLWMTGMLGDVRRHLTRMIGYRSCAEVGASCFFQSGLTRLPFADVGAIGQINPLVVTAAAAFFLGEKVGWRRWTATAVGLLGALLIIRPGGSSFQWASLLILGAVFCSVSRDMITRKMETGFSPFVLAALSSAAIGTSSLMFWPFETWIWPAALDVFWLAFPAILMMAGQTLVVISIRAGEVSAVVPFRYAAIVWSLMYSFLIWGEVPDGLTFLGIAIVCGAGLYTFHREQVRRRETAMRNVSAAVADPGVEPVVQVACPARDRPVQAMALAAGRLAIRGVATAMRGGYGAVTGVAKSLAFVSHVAASADARTRHMPWRANGTLVGIAAMTASMLCFNIGDTLIKVAGTAMPVGEMLFLRGIFASLLVLGYCAHVGVLSRLPQLLTPLIGMRMTMEGLCSLLFFVGLVRMSYADAAALGQFTPLMVMAGAALFLGEAVGWRRWSAALIGFVGVLLIIKPGTSAFQPVAIVVLLSMACVAARDLLTRLVPKDVPTTILAAGSGLTGLVTGLVMAPFEAAWRWPSVYDLLLMAVCAITVMGAYVFIIVAMRAGSTAVTSPFRYTYMLFATLSSLIVFRERPDAWSWLGIGLIVGAGLYMLYREHVVLRRLSGSSVPAAAE